MYQGDYSGASQVTPKQELIGHCGVSAPVCPEASQGPRLCFAAQPISGRRGAVVLGRGGSQFVLQENVRKRDKCVRKKNPIALVYEN